MHIATLLWPQFPHLLFCSSQMLQGLMSSFFFFAISADSVVQNQVQCWPYWVYLKRNLKFRSITCPYCVISSYEKEVQSQFCKVVMW